MAVGQVREAQRVAGEARDDSELAASVAGVDSLVAVLQQERNLTGTYLRDSGLPPEIEVRTLSDARPLTDEALETFTATVEAQTTEIAEAYRPALVAIAGRDDSVASLAELRARVDGYRGERSMTMNDPISAEAFEGYNALIDLLFAGNASVSAAFEDEDLRRGVELIRLSVKQSDTIARFVRAALVVGVATDEGALDTPAEISEFALLNSTLRSNDTSILTKASGPYRELARDLYASEAVRHLPRIVETALEAGAVDLAPVVDYLGQADTVDFDYRNFSVGVADAMQNRATALTNDAERRLRLYLAFGVPAVLVAAMCAWIVAGTITRPLASLTRQAAEMARHKLPRAVEQILETPLGEDVAIPHVTPISVKTRDEVGDVVEALNRVQAAAVELAVEQAVLRRNIADSFVSIGRRNQNLLHRQLDFITDLEREETDPDVLANLFQLDHLATRMRRNAESLLMLAGLEPPRAWSAPVSIADVIRAALGEVEHYRRVVLSAVEPITILGSVAADVTHLLAELTENALTYSEGIVHVQGNLAPTGYVIAVIDSGPGIAPDELERANRRLNGAESFTVAPSKYLGHYVAGHLAARHNITVQLHNQHDHDPARDGLVAAVNLPLKLLGSPPGLGQSVACCQREKNAPLLDSVQPYGRH